VPAGAYSAGDTDELTTQVSWKVPLMRFNRITVFTHLLAASIALSPAMGAAATRGAATISASSIRIDNFGQISESYYRGAQPYEGDYAALAALGIKTVIDLQADGSPAEQRLVEAAGMTFHRIPMTTHTAPTDDQLAQFLDIVNDPENQPVYVHCAGGRHRTGAMTAVYRMTHDGWTADQAFKEMKQYDFGADFLHPEFKRFVYSYRPAPKGSAPLRTAAITRARTASS
jgi:protein tyrosine phosphatase (PTP) superfamily phosphohydrolase (DUF442 family)